ncbi:MAG TPA: PilZ domain-containing protein [Thermoanaerobaculia bacterium]|nr:PilZ domain-containing protein [Thermoanaerobaculia bacterium]
MHESSRNLRTAERFLLAPPLAATFGAAPVAVCDISEKGARFRHDRALEAGAKSVLQIAAAGAPVSLEAIVVWTQPDAQFVGKFLSGVRTYAPADVVQSLLAHLQTSKRSHRIEELRSTDRFYVAPSLDGMFGGREVRIEDLSARGARIVAGMEPRRASSAALQFVVPSSDIEVVVNAQVAWTSLKAITGATRKSYRAGLFIAEKAELMRLAIGRLCEMNRAALDMHSLRLKLKVLRARARQLAPSYPQIEAAGIPAEQYLLIQGVREELRLNPDEAVHWYRRARLIIADPATRDLAPSIAHHPDALAVWEYLDRSVDPSIVSRAFELKD